MHYVFNTEGNNEILGEYVRSDEDVIIYFKPGSATCDSYGFGQAAADCVTVREVTRSEIVQEIERFKRLLDEVSQWADTLTGMNSLMALQAEMREYAYVMGARLSDSAAHRDVLRRTEAGNFIGARAHSRSFEETPAGVREPAEKF